MKKLCKKNATNNAKTMSKLTAENFWKIWSESAVSAPAAFYRLYYNDDGSPVCYTMEDLPGNYVEVDTNTYLVGSHNVRVVDQKLIHLPTVGLVTKLRPNASTGTACDPHNICVVVDENTSHVKWSLQ
jgi:hypothetical protein